MGARWEVASPQRLRPYSLECVEGVFSEVRIRHLAYRHLDEGAARLMTLTRVEAPSQHMRSLHKDSLCRMPPVLTPL